MSENKFWLSIWSLVAAAIAVLICACTIVSLDTKAKWEKAVAGGADPMVVACALNLSYNGHSADAIICSNLAQNRK